MPFVDKSLPGYDVGMHDRKVERETERKNAEMERQRQLAEKDGVKKNERLGDVDKTSADSFPASDPPTPP
jgi:hypothetical protein